ncbi:MAG: hypothetical protein ACXVNM_00805 [Bacteroidia bacterium]
MLLIASSLALLVVYAGVKLLIQSKKEALVNQFRYAAWFFIVAGFLILACTGAFCIAMCCSYGAKMMHGQHSMMGSEGHCMKEHQGEYKKMMKYHHQYEGGGCMINRNCCDSQMEKCCDKSNMCKPDSMKCRK